MAESEMMKLTAQMNFEQAQAMKVANLMSLLSSIKEFDGDVRTLECFIQRMDQVQGLMDGARLDECSLRSLQGFMLSKIDMALLLELGLSFSSTWAAARGRLKERYRGATKTAGRVAWRMIRLTLESSETLVGFCRRVNDAFGQTRDRVTESVADAAARKVQLEVYEELAMETLMNGLPERLRTAVRAGEPKTLEEMIQLIREEELEREELRGARTKPERRSYVEAARAPFVRPRVEVRPERPRRNFPLRQGRNEEAPRGPRRSPEPRGRGAPRIQCWECNGEGHLARQCRYRRMRGQRREWDEFPRRGDGGEPMDVNAIERGRDRRRSPGQGCPDRRGSVSSYSEGTQSEGEQEESRAGRSGGEEAGEGGEWTVVSSGRYPWRKKTQKQD